MPENMKVKADKTFGFGFSQVAMSLLSSMDQPVPNPDAQVARYREMLDDETIGTGLEFLTYSVVGKIRAYSHPDPKVKDLVDASLEALRGTIEEARRSLLEKGLSFGFGVSEFTLANSGGQWLLSSLQTYDPGTLKFLFERAPDNSVRIRTVRQSVGGRDIDIPVEKCMIYHHGMSTSPYGRSRLKRCWRWYAFKRVMPKFWAVALERFGMPALVGRSTDIEAMDELLEQAYSKSHFAISPDDEIQALSGGSSTGMGAAYSSAIEFCNRMLYRAMFLPSLLEGGEGGGSYSLGQVHWRMFNDACLWLARELVEVEIEQLWRPLIEWNFGPQEEYGEWDVSDSGTPEEKQIMANVFLSGVNGGFLFPDEGDAEWMRERLGFPPVEEGSDPVAWRHRLSRISRPSQTGSGNGAEVNPTSSSRPR